MTEESFQQARKLMQKANHMRGLITAAKGDVAKWTKIEDVHRQELRPGQADGAKNMLQKAMAQLDKFRLQFTELKFPEDNIVAPRKTRVCSVCGTPTAENETKCSACESIII